MFICTVLFFFPSKALTPTLCSTHCIIPAQFMEMNFSLTQMCLIFPICIPACNLLHSVKWQSASFALKCSWSPPNLINLRPTGPRLNLRQKASLFTDAIICHFQTELLFKGQPLCKTASSVSAGVLCVNTGSQHTWIEDCGIKHLCLWVDCGLWTEPKQYLLWQNSKCSFHQQWIYGMAWQEYDSV